MEDPPFSGEQRHAIVLATQACASLSFVGSATIVLANFRFKQLRTYSFQLVVWLAVCDIFVNVSFFLGSPQDESARCTTQAFVQQFFQVALIQWTLLVSQSLLVLASRTKNFDGKFRMPWNHLWAWGISGALTLGPWSTGSFGSSETSFCWIQSDGSWGAGALWRLIFLLVVLLSMVFVVWTYIAVVGHLGRSQRDIVLLSDHSARRTIASSRPASLSPESPRSLPTPNLGHLKASLDRTRPTPRGSTTSRLGSTGEKFGHASAAETVGTLDEGRLGRVQEGHCEEQGIRKKRTQNPSMYRGKEDTGKGYQDSAPSKSDVATDDGETGCKMPPTYDHGGAGTAAEGHGMPGCSGSEVAWPRPISGGGQVSAKNWLWSASKDGGFSADGNKGPAEDKTNFGALGHEKASIAVFGASGRLGWTRDQTLRPICLVPPGFRAYDRRVKSSVRTSESFKSHSCIAAPSEAQKILASLALPLEEDTGWRGATEVSKTNSVPPRRASWVAGGAERAQTWIYSMSNFDVDPLAEARLKRNGSIGDLNPKGFASSVSFDPSIRISRDKGIAWASGGAIRTPSDAGRARRGSVSDMTKFVARVKWYPVIYVLCWVFTLVSGINVILAGDANAGFALVFLANVTARLQGLLNFLWYGLNDRVKQAWLQDLFYRRAVASCCRAVWWCCCSPCLLWCCMASPNDDLEATLPTENKVDPEVSRATTANGEGASVIHGAPSPILPPTRHPVSTFVVAADERSEVAMEEGGVMLMQSAVSSGSVSHSAPTPHKADTEGPRMGVAHDRRTSAVDEAPAPIPTRLDSQDRDNVAATEQGRAASVRLEDLAGGASRVAPTAEITGREEPRTDAVEEEPAPVARPSRRHRPIFISKVKNDDAAIEEGTAPLVPPTVSARSKFPSLNRTGLTPHPPLDEIPTPVRRRRSTLRSLLATPQRRDPRGLLSATPPARPDRPIRCSNGTSKHTIRKWPSAPPLRLPPSIGKSWSSVSHGEERGVSPEYLGSWGRPKGSPRLKSSDPDGEGGEGNPSSSANDGARRLRGPEGCSTNRGFETTSMWESMFSTSLGLEKLERLQQASTASRAVATIPGVMPLASEPWPWSRSEQCRDGGFKEGKGIRSSHRKGKHDGKGARTGRRKSGDALDSRGEGGSVERKASDEDTPARGQSADPISESPPALAVGTRNSGVPMPILSE